MNQLNPKAVRFFFFQYLPKLLLVVGIIGGFGSIIAFSLTRSPQIWIWVIVAVVGIIICYIWALLTYRNWRYDFTDEGVEIEKGVIRKEHSTIPYTRIQNVDVKQDLISRLLGLGKVVVQTAGSSGGAANYSALRRVIRFLAYHYSKPPEKKGEGIIPGLDIKKARKFQETLTEGI